jgi:hypothetical protein
MLDNGAAPCFGVLPKESATGESTTSIAEHQYMESNKDSNSE